MDEVRVLSFNLPAELDAVRTGLLSRPPFAATAVSRAAQLLIHLEGGPYRLMLLAMPGDGLEFKSILPILRNPTMPSHRGAVVLLTPGERVAEHEAYLREGLNAVLPLTSPPEAVEAEIARQVSVAPRANSRIMVRLKAAIRAPSAHILCQTSNLSSTGLFLAHKANLPVGTVFTFELMLPGAKKPVAGEAKVVRHAVAEKEKVEGMGAAFTALAPEDRKLIQDFVDRLRSEGGA